MLASCTTWLVGPEEAIPGNCTAQHLVSDQSVVDNLLLVFAFRSQSGATASPPQPSDEGPASLSVQLSVMQAELACSQQQLVELSQALAASEAAKAMLQEQLEHLDVKVRFSHTVVAWVDGIEVLLHWACLTTSCCMLWVCQEAVWQTADVGDDSDLWPGCCTS